MSVPCRIRGCYGPLLGRIWGADVCARHAADITAPPMKLTCECVEPEWEWLPVFGDDCGYCRKCGSPIEGTLAP